MNIILSKLQEKVEAVRTSMISSVSLSFNFILDMNSHENRSATPKSHLTKTYKPYFSEKTPLIQKPKETSKTPKSKTPRKKSKITKNPKNSKNVKIPKNLKKEKKPKINSKSKKLIKRNLAYEPIHKRMQKVIERK